MSENTAEQHVLQDSVGRHPQISVPPSCVACALPLRCLRAVCCNQKVTAWQNPGESLPKGPNCTSAAPINWLLSPGDPFCCAVQKEKREQHPEISSRSLWMAQLGRLLQRCLPLAGDAVNVQFTSHAAAVPVLAAVCCSSSRSWHFQQQHVFSTGSSDTPPPADPVADQFERMLEVMMSNPTAMQMMMSRMPPHMRKPEVLKAMLSNPDVRARMSALAQEKVRRARHVCAASSTCMPGGAHLPSEPAQALSPPRVRLTSASRPCAACLPACLLQGLASIIQGVDLDKVSAGMSATLQAGIDPARLIQRFQESPSLAKAMENPRVLAALMDMAT